MVRLHIVAVSSVLSLAVSACGHDRPANDASSANAAQETEPSKGDTPSGNNLPTDSTIGTGMAPDSNKGSPGASSGNGSDGSSMGARGNGSSNP